MTSSLYRRGRFDLELRVLRAFCGAQSVPSKSLLSRLSNYQWLELDHEVVYRAICASAVAPRTVTQEILPVFATRAGFPDLDWDAYFAPPESELGGLSDAIEALLAETH